MTTGICQLTGEEFEVGAIEMGLRKKFELEGIPKYAPWVRFLWLGAFWQHWNLHPRKCDKTGKDIISTYRPDCQYKVYEREEWLKNDDIVGADVDTSNVNNPVFTQLKQFFFKNAIPHIVGGAKLENSPYADDGLESKNIYLAHSFYKSEDCAYSYWFVARDCYYCTMCFDAELCYDCINCYNCYNSIYLLSCQKCVDSAFLYDCRNCNDCFLSSNLRNKKYVFANIQRTKEEYDMLKNEYNLKSRAMYEQCKGYFREMMKEHSVHKAVSIVHSEDCFGDYIEESKNCEGVYLSQKSYDCANIMRGYESKDCLDSIAPGLGELIFNSTSSGDRAYEIRYSVFCIESSYLEYCMYCYKCEHCFGCIGLKNKKFYIFNKPYSEAEYHVKKREIIEFMRSTGEYGEFFPFDMSAVPYEESWSSYYFPLNTEQKAYLKVLSKDTLERQNNNYVSENDVPDSSENIKTEDIVKNIYWDESAKRPFQIRREDCIYADKMGVPLPYTYYIRRLQENFRWMLFDGKLKTVFARRVKRKYRLRGMRYITIIFFVKRVMREKLGSRISFLCSVDKGKECFIDNIGIEYLNKYS